MSRRISTFFTLTAALFLTTALILAVPSFFDAEFEVRNQASDAVSVVATWQSQEKTIGNVEPMSSHEFSTNAEAVMKFTVRYPSGRVSESEPLYFTSGTKIIATITDDGVAARYDFETRQGSHAVGETWR